MQTQSLIIRMINRVIVMDNELFMTTGKRVFVTLLLLVPFLAHAGMESWMHLRAAPTTDTNTISVDKHQHEAAGTGAPTSSLPLDSHSCHLPYIECDCQDCISYFDILGQALLLADNSPLSSHTPPGQASGNFAPLFSLVDAPPTPPPRS